MKTFNVNDVFMNDEDNIMLRILSYTGEGVESNYYCILESNGDCWNGYHSYHHIKNYYTVMKGF